MAVDCMKTTPKIFFDHIPKTAGSSLRMFFAEAFGEEKVSPALKNMKAASALSIYRDMQVIIGHFGFIPGDTLPEGYIHATVLRDPRERVLSDYYYQREDVPDMGLGQEERAIKELPIEEVFFHPQYSKRFYNFQAVHFAAFFHLQPQSLPPDELLSLAKKGLEQYHLVGTNERLSEFIEHIKTVFGLPKDLILKRYNVTSRRKRFSEMPLTLQKRIEELNRVDLELWRYADSLFDSRTKRFTLSSESFEAFAGKAVEGKADNRPASVNHIEDGSLELLGVTVRSQMRPNEDLIAGELAVLEITFRCLRDIDDLTVGYSIHHDSGLHIFGVNTRLFGHKMRCLAGGDYGVSFTFPVQLGIGTYYVNISAHAGLAHTERCYLWRERVAAFNVVGFLDINFEGLVRLMPSISFGVAGGSGAIEADDLLKDESGFQRLGIATPELTDLRGAVAALSEVPAVRPGEQFAIPVEIRNESKGDCIGEGTKSVHISYHWKRPDGEVVVFDGVRTPIPGRLVPKGASVRASAMVEAPKEEGEFLLELTLVQEHVCWFEDRGFASAVIEVSVGSA